MGHALCESIRLQARMFLSPFANKFAQIGGFFFYEHPLDVDIMNLATEASMPLILDAYAYYDSITL